MSLENPVLKAMRPAEKIRLRGSETLSYQELLSLILPARNGAEKLAESLHMEYGTRLLTERMTVEQLMKTTGMSRSTAVRLLAVVELGRRMFEPSCTDFPVIHSPADVYAWVPEMRRFRQEHFRCLYLNSVNRVIGDRTISIGTINSSLVHPREVFHGAVEYAANTLVMIHNHPSGSLEPSAQDLRITKQIHEAGRLFSIPVLDHLIITESGYYSFKDHARL